MAQALKLRCEWIPVPVFAEQIGAPVRAVVLAGKRGEIEIIGPRCARVVRRSEAERWLTACAAKKPEPKLATVTHLDEVNAGADKAAARFASRGGRR